MVFQNIITLIRSTPALIAIIKVVFNNLNSFNKNINLKSLKTFVKNLTLSILLLFLGMFLLMSMLLIIYMLCHILLINDEKITLTLLVVVEVTIALGIIVFVWKKHLYRTYYLKIDYDLTYNSKQSNKIHEEMLEISKKIEKFRKNNDIENYKRALKKLNQLYNSKEKLNKLTMVYNCLKCFTHTLTYPAIIILYTYLAIEDKLIYSWFFYLAITLLTIGFISMIFLDISNNNSKFKVTENMLETHLKRYNKEAEKMESSKS